METVQGEVPPYGVKETLVVNGTRMARHCSFFIMTGLSDVNVTVVPELPFDRIL